MYQKIKKKTELCVIFLTYNRPKYIERSIYSLYKRAGMQFDLHVFDDCSDSKTISVLNSLKNKFNFNLHLNKSRENIARSFSYAITNVPDNYKFYMKLDSDIELLSDDLLKQALEIFDFSNRDNRKVCGVTPRVEGVFSFEKYPNDIEFYNGHVIRLKTSICFGCAMIFTNEVFKEFKKMSEDSLNAKENVKWGVDTKLYSTILSFGSFVTVEDLSVYHIDNSFGQRKDFKYFTERKRWSIIDYEDVWFLKASRCIYPAILSKIRYKYIREVSSDFEDFLKNCKLYLKDNIEIVKKKVDKEEKEKLEKERLEKIAIEKKKETFVKVYRITSPNNFRPDKNIPHGSSMYFAEVPEWAKKNSRVIVENVMVSSKELESINNI